MECVQLDNCIILSQAIKLYRRLNTYNKQGRINRHESTDVFGME